MTNLFEDVARRWKSFADDRRRAATIDDNAVKRAYARWAPVYDIVFGAAFRSGHRAAVDFINELPPGRILECGVGTGISLPYYRHDHRITGIDLSPNMLKLARQRVIRHKLNNVEALTESDAGNLAVADDAFDASVAMYVITVAPDPGAVMAELIRVTRPGGAVVLVSHFLDQEGWRKWIGEKLAPLSASLGWNINFSIERVLGKSELRLVDRRRVGPIGLFTLLVFKKEEAHFGRSS